MFQAKHLELFCSIFHTLSVSDTQVDTRTTPRTFLKCAHLSARTINFNIVVKNLYTKTTGAS